MVIAMVEVLLVVQSILIVLFGILLLMVIRQVGILNLRIGPSGSRTMGNGPIIGADLSNDEFVRRLIEERWNSRRFDVLVAFVSPYCAGCHMLLPVLRAVSREEKDHLRVIAVARELEENSTFSMRRELGREVLLLEDAQLFDRWSVSGTPYCVVVDSAGRVAGKGLAHTVEHVESLLTTLDLKAATIDDFMEQRDGINVTSSSDQAVGTLIKGEKGS